MNGSEEKRSAWQSGNNIQEMKRKYIDFELLTSYNELYNGWLRATAGKKGERSDAQEFGATPEILEKNLKDLQRRLREGVWKASPGRTFK